MVFFIDHSLEKDDVCVFQEVSVLNPGQSLTKYLEGDFCYTIECLEDKDNNTGFHTFNVTMVNCSKACDIVSILISRSGGLVSLKFPVREFELVNALWVIQLNSSSTLLFYEISI